MLLRRPSFAASVAAVAVAAVAWAPQPALAAVVGDQAQDVATSFEGFAGAQSLAQTYTAGRSGRLVSVSLRLAKQAIATPSPANPFLTVEVLGTTGGLPSGATLASVTLSQDSVPNRASDDSPPTPITANFSASAVQGSGTQYAIRLTTASNSAAFFWYGSASDTYAGGTALFRESPTSEWVVRPGDRTFSVRVDADADGDTYDAGADCNDADAAVNPGATEAYNGKDDDCDGVVDEGFTAYYADADGDGYGAGAATHATAQPAGRVANATDCNDSSAAVNPGATETANGIDDDCDGAVDESAASFYRDGDGDGYGAGAAVVASTAPAGHVGNSGDCDDAAAAVSPGATEAYNGKDDDCDGVVDEGFTAYYADADGDGFGAGAATHATTAPAGHVTKGGDCDDTDAAANPGAAEARNGKDDDCDGIVDEGAVAGTAIGIGISPSKVRFGQPATVVITGSPGATVDLYSRKFPTTEFTRIRTGLVLDGAGRMSVVTRPDVNLRFQARDSAGTLRSSIAGADGLVTVEKHVTLTVRRTGTRTYSFSGSVNPLNPGATVSLYRNGVLQKGGIPVAGTRAYAYITTFAGSGTFTFQVRTPSTGYNALSSSPAVVVRLF